MLRKKILSDEEVKRAAFAFLSHPDRKDSGATSGDIIKIVQWVEQVKVDMLLNKTILKEIYNGNLVLDLDSNDEVVMAAKPEVNPPDPLTEVFLHGDMDDYQLGVPDGD